MPIPESESIDASARGKTGADVSASERVELANRYYGLIKFVIGGIVLVTIWVTTMQIDVASLKMTRTERNSQINALQIYDTANDKIIGQIGGRIDQHQKDIASLDKRVGRMEPDVQDMAFMRDNGIANRDRFERDHGYFPEDMYKERPNP